MPPANEILNAMDQVHLRKTTCMCLSFYIIPVRFEIQFGQGFLTNNLLEELGKYSKKGPEQICFVIKDKADFVRISKVVFSLYTLYIVRPTYDGDPSW